ncbi:Abi family protein [Corynebacterium aurimucosum]|uniref:Abi family protein n=1 Tax=Corynebacterium aurimucosum TaxID=169292 RepID=UPI001879B083|nr:Abi family protein [Corynebacterium aurimucosum]MBE7365932.1 Abi family protein [Corynebacterium aurimucosum]
MAATPQPLKQFKNYPDQVALMASRGMLITDHVKCESLLQEIGYYRLSAYSYQWRESDGITFVPGTNFDDVISLYEFDRELRYHFFRGLGEIEIALRSRLGYKLGSLGPDAHLDKSNFLPGIHFMRTVQQITTRFERALRSKDPIAIHHMNKYGGSIPIWVLVDFLDFSDLSKLYSALAMPHQHSIAQDLGLIKKKQSSGRASSPDLGKWLKQLSIVRNYCAHHSRLWDRPLKPVGVAQGRVDDFFSDFGNRENSTNLYGAATITAFLLNGIGEYSSWAVELRDLILNNLETIPMRSPSEAGFKQGWEKLSHWQ